MAFIVHGASPFTPQAMANDLMGAISQPNPENHLVCVGCDNFRAANQDELREHYKTEWHRHNLKRKTAGLAPIARALFEERVAVYAPSESSARAKKKEHLGKKALEKQAAREQRAIQKAQEQASREEMEAGAPAGEIEVQDNGPDFENMTEEEFMDWRAANAVQLAPGDSLFDRNSERTLEMNLEYMAVKFGFFVPFVEHVEDLDGLMEYLRQRLTIGCSCLWCSKTFHSFQAVQAHMRDRSHCKINFEGEEDEYQDFYGIDLRSKTGNVLSDDEWETDEEEEVDAMEEMEEEERVPTVGRKALAARICTEMAKPIRNMVVGDKVLGHRAFSKYYRQKLKPELSVAHVKRDAQQRAKIVGLIAGTYQQQGIVAQYKGSTRAAKANRQQQNADLHTRAKWWTKVGIRANKFHQVRREDYHA